MSMSMGMGMGGPHLEDELSALLDGELSLDEAVAARAHLAECAVCTAELAATARTRDAVRSLPMLDPPVPLTLPDEDTAAARSSRPPSLVPAAAAAVFVLFALQWLPAGRSVAPQVAGFDRTHASIVQSAPAALTSRSAVQAQPIVDRTGFPGYERVATYRKGQRVHVLYSDGDHALSVFAEPGDLAESKLPAGARTLKVPGHTLWHWNRPDGDIVLWQSDGVVFAAVGDAPIAQVLEAAASMPDEDRETSVPDRIRRGCRALAELLTGS